MRIQNSAIVTGTIVVAVINFVVGDASARLLAAALFASDGCQVGSVASRSIGVNWNLDSCTDTHCTSPPTKKCSISGSSTGEKFCSCLAPADPTCCTVLLDDGADPPSVDCAADTTCPGEQECVKFEWEPPSWFSFTCHCVGE